MHALQIVVIIFIVIVIISALLPVGVMRVLIFLCVIFDGRLALHELVSVSVVVAYDAAMSVKVEGFLAALSLVGFGTLQIPELVEEGVVLLFLKRLHYFVQILLRMPPHYLVTFVEDLSIDDPLARLKSFHEMLPNGEAKEY